MYETEYKTVGFGCGYETGTQRGAGYRSARLVSVRPRRSVRPHVRKEDARTRRQPRTGVSYRYQQMTGDSVSQFPERFRDYKPRDWLVAVLFALSMSGVLPMLACGLLTMLCEAVGWWPLFLLVAAEFAFFYWTVLR